MKKVLLGVVLATLGGLAVNAFADVQNIRLSGDIRLRGYYLDNAGADTEGDYNQKSGDASFIEQRTRVCVEADLEDHVLVVVTLKAESLWGGDNEVVHNTAGAGSQGLDGSINRGFDVGVDEAYVQLNEVFYTPATIKLGRQYLNYGHGLILSKFDEEYNFDAARMVLDLYPWTLDIVGAELVNGQSFGANSDALATPPTGHTGSEDLLFVNLRYEMTDSVLKDFEAYVGYLAQGSSGHPPTFNTTVPPSEGGVSGNTGSAPVILGLRGDLNLAEGLTAYGEAAYETGGNGDPGAGSLSAFLLNLGAKYGRKDLVWSPVINASYTVASGGGSNGNSDFVPWFDYTDGYNGYLFSPELSNIQILNLGLTVKPWENMSLGAQGYYYMKENKNSPVMSNPNVDFGGLGYASAATIAAGSEAPSRSVGWEFDFIAGYDYSKDVRAQLVYAMFIPEGTFTDLNSNGDRSPTVAHEVRAELDVKF